MSNIENALRHARALVNDRAVANASGFPTRADLDDVVIETATRYGAACETSIRAMLAASITTEEELHEEGPDELAAIVARFADEHGIKDADDLGVASRATEAQRDAAGDAANAGITRLRELGLSYEDACELLKIAIDVVTDMGSE